MSVDGKDTWFGSQSRLWRALVVGLPVVLAVFLAVMFATGNVGGGGNAARFTGSWHCVAWPDETAASGEEADSEDVRMMDVVMGSFYLDLTEDGIAKATFGPSEVSFGSWRVVDDESAIMVLKTSDEDVSATFAGSFIMSKSDGMLVLEGQGGEADGSTFVFAREDTPVEARVSAFSAELAAADDGDA